MRVVVCMAEVPGVREIVSKDQRGGQWWEGLVMCGNEAAHYTWAADAGHSQVP